MPSAPAPPSTARCDSAYAVADQLTTDPGLFARPDIGWRHAPRPKVSTLKKAVPMTVMHTAASASAAVPDAYAAAGVSFSAGDAAIEQIADAVKQTHNERVVAGVGSFGGVFDMADLGLDQPLLVSSTDTCGTKTVLAAELDQWDGIGADIVNHGVNDVLVQGARPLFMLDTISAGVLDPDIVGRVVRSMAKACKANGCVLLGGETAEVPDLIVPGGVDVAGTMVGVVDRRDLLPSSDIVVGDVLVGLASSGLHTNGYSLARRLGAAYGFDRPVPGTDVRLGDALLAPHRSYLEPLAAALGLGTSGRPAPDHSAPDHSAPDHSAPDHSAPDHSASDRGHGPRIVKALAHLTGGGFPDNIPRCLPAGLGATVDTSAWDTPPLFRWLQEAGGLDLVEAHRIFNMGIGMVAIVAAADVDTFRGLVDEPTFVLGAVTDRPGVVLS